MTNTRICLWSSPRNVSTAFMYSWAQRPDTVVVDEPLYGYYLQNTGAAHPGRAEILQTMDCNAQRVINKMCFGNYTKPVVFFKHMTHHTVAVNLSFMQRLHNLFFIRNPLLIINSYAKVIEMPAMADIGMEMQWKCYQFAQQNGYKTTVLDSGELLKNPEKVLKTLCAELNIPFYADMLQWPRGARPEDGVWAKYWYANVHQSSGFEIPPTDLPVLPNRLLPLYEAAKPFYQQLYQHSIKA